MVPPSAAGTSQIVVTVNDNNYQGSASGTLTIAKATASVTPNAAGKIYGAADPGLTGTLTGFVPLDNVTASYRRTAGETVAGSPYPISATLSPSSVLANYNITYNTAPFTITPAGLLGGAQNATAVYGQPLPSLTS